MGNCINIAFGLDAQFVPHAAATIASIKRHTPPKQMCFIVLHSGIDAPQKRILEDITPGSTFRWIEVSDDDLPPFQGTRLNRTTLYRLGLEKLAPRDYERVIYLDADVIVMADLRQLWRMDLGDFALGAVEDGYQNPDDFALRWDLHNSQRYFNAGVLLIDLAKVRRDALFSQTIDFIAKNGKDLPNNDQDALNYVFWNRWRPLDAKWNVQRIMSMPEIEHELPEQRRLNGESPRIIHFEGPEKPWLPDSWHPWAWTYWNNLARTPFKQVIETRHGLTRSQQSRLLLRWLRRHPLKARLTQKFSMLAKVR